MTARLFHGLVALLALGLIGLGLNALNQHRGTVVLELGTVGTAPVTVYRPSAGRPARDATVVIAHGFAGSRQLMDSFGRSLALNGYRAVSFDFLGHGRNPLPLTGDVTKVAGATRALVTELSSIIDAEAAAHPDHEILLLGHSMASDIIVRQAVADARVKAVIAVSMFSQAVTATAPRNLLMITGGWEGFLAAESLESLRLADEDAGFGETNGDPVAGTARRAVLAPSVEHVGVLYSATALREAVGWAHLVTGAADPVGPIDARGGGIVLLLLGLVTLAWPLSRLLPGLGLPQSEPLGWRGQTVVTVGPALFTPLVLWPFDISFLPVLVADYLAVHFLVYGLLKIGLLLWLRAPVPTGPVATVLAVSAVVAGYGIFGIGGALDTHVASFWPHPGRIALIAAIFCGTLPFMLADGWAAMGGRGRLWRVAAGRLAFLASLVLAIALNLEDLFFLAIIFPVVVLFFLLFGMIEGWVSRATGHPAPGAIGNAAVLAWALGVTFPLLG